MKERPISESTELERESLIPRKTYYSGEKTTYASIVRKGSNTDIQRKLNKQNKT